MTESNSLNLDTSASSSRVHGWRRLLLALAAGTGLWGFLLPWLGQREAIADHIELQRHHGIDPSAMYYSELETLPPIVHRLEKLHTTNHAELWGR
jgi:hypothetical protein